MPKFRDLSEIPTKYRSIFSHINQFNHVQSEVFDDVLKTSKFSIMFGLTDIKFIVISNFPNEIEKHIVVSAPTGSGKTKIFELAIVELLMSLEPANCETSNAKIIYGNVQHTFAISIATIHNFIEICVGFFPSHLQLHRQRRYAMKCSKCGERISVPLT